MDTWLIVLIVIAVVVLAVLALLMARRSKAGAHRKEEQAREHLQEAQLRATRAEREHALAEEQAARARRERAEVEERAAVAEREATERVANAERDRTAADELRAKAEKLAPGVTADQRATAPGNGPSTAPGGAPGYAAQDRDAQGHIDRGYGDQGYTERTEVVRDHPGDGQPPQREVVDERQVGGQAPQRDTADRAADDAAHRDRPADDPAYREGYGGVGATRLCVPVRADVFPLEDARADRVREPSSCRRPAVRSRASPHTTPEDDMTDLLAVGTRKGLFLARSDDGRRTWTVDGPHLLAQEVAAVSIDTRGGGSPRVLAAILYGHWGPTVMRSDDLGATWQETESGAIRFPEDAGAALGRVWQLRPDTADRPDVVWAGCEPHSLWRSTDRGENFSLVRSLWDHPHRPTWQPGAGGGAVHTVLPDPASDRITVAMSTGGVYVSEDAGDSWTPRNKGITVPFMPDELPEYGQCVHKVAVDAGDVNRMYAQNHGGVFRTDDAGSSWTSISGGLPVEFGFPVVASPRTPGTAWVVPLVADMQRVPLEGRLRVHRTTDAGETWTEVGSGLPDSAWTAVVRDAFCADAHDPTGLYVGTRDGCLYASSDAGDTFSLVVDHLPDVLVVRAAELP